MLPVTSIGDIKVTVCSSQAPAVSFEKKTGDAMSSQESLCVMDDKSAISLAETGGDSTVDSLVVAGDDRGSTMESLASNGDSTVNSLVVVDDDGGSTMESLASTGDSTVNSLVVLDDDGDSTMERLASTGNSTVNSLVVVDDDGDSTINRIDVSADNRDSMVNNLYVPNDDGDSIVNNLYVPNDDNDIMVNSLDIARDDGYSKVNCLDTACDDKAEQSATDNKILREIHNMDELELKKYISELQRKIVNVKQGNEYLALKLKENEISCEEVSLQLGSINEEMENQRLVFNQKEMLLKEELISKKQRIESVQSEIITHEEMSRNDMKVVQIQLDDTLKTSTELHERLQSVENKVLWKTKIVELVQKQMEKVATMHCGVEEKLVLKKRFWKKSSQSRKAKSLQLLEGSRRLINRLQALFM